MARLSAGPVYHLHSQSDPDHEISITCHCVPVVLDLTDGATLVVHRTNGETPVVEVVAYAKTPAVEVPPPPRPERKVDIIKAS